LCSTVQLLVTQNRYSDIFETVVWQLLFASMALPTLERIQAMLAEVQVEAFMFVLAFGIHFFLFNGFRLVPHRGKAVEEKKCTIKSTAPETEVDGGVQADRCLPRKETRPQQKMDVAYQKGHWAAALRHWYAQRDNGATTPGQLLQVVEAMQRLNLANASKMHEINHFLSNHPGSCHVEFINRLFTRLVQTMDMEVIASLFDCLPKFKIKPDSQTYEMLIQMHFTMQNSDEMQRLAQDMEANGVVPSVATKVTLLKDALKKGDLDVAIPLYCQVHESCPNYVESTLASLACQKRQGTRVIGCFESNKLPLRTEMLDCMVRANLQMRDRKLAARISKLCKTFGIEVDSRNKHVLVGSGQIQIPKRGEASSVGEGRRPPAEAGHAACEASQEAGSEEPSDVPWTSPAEASGSWTPHNMKGYWEQHDNKKHWQSGGSRDKRSGKWVEASSDRSWEWANCSLGSTKKPWVNKNCRKTWTPAEMVQSSRAPLLTARAGVTAVQSSNGASIRPPPGLELECDKAMGTGRQDQEKACKLAVAGNTLHMPEGCWEGEKY